MYIVSMDIGGSSIKSALFIKDGLNINMIGTMKTHILKEGDFEEIKEIVLGICRSFLICDSPLCIAISTSGAVDELGVVIKARCFRNYVNINWARILAEELGNVNVFTINDGRASAWGEYASISDIVGNKTLIHAVIGTGIGGAIVSNGEILKGDNGYAGYIGHMKVTSQKTMICSCGKMGCAESMASAKGITHQYLKLKKNVYKELMFDQVLDLFSADSENIIKILTYCGYWLGLALGNTMNLLNPEMVTVGGGVVAGTEKLKTTFHLQSNPYFQGILNGIFASAHENVLEQSTVKIGNLGNTAGLLGAASLACKRFYK